ncbi:MAG: ester cyclase [Candidatus Kariarchaeaceae archaeon]|jgi:predicted ester cyclase
MVSSGNKTIVKLFLKELYTKWNFDIAKEIVHSDFKREKSSVIGWQVHLLDINSLQPGPQGVILAAQAMKRTFPNFKFSIHRILEENNEVAVYWTAKGTYKIQNQQFEYEGAHFFKIQQGKIIDLRFTFDTLTYFLLLEAAELRKANSSQINKYLNHLRQSGLILDNSTS